jgi:2-methylcitrate dehydratase PrpD
MEQTQTIRLATFVAETGFDNLPPAVLQAGKRCFLDCLGAALGGAHSRAATMVAELAAESGGKPQATLLARGKLAPLLDAALINATAAHALDYDDTLSPPAALAGVAVAEYHRLSGRNLITSYVLGFEIASRLASAIGGWDNARGWHMMGVAGGFGAAATGAVLLRLTSDQTAHALGIAATQAAGLVAMHGSLVKPVHSGKAAANGLFAAQLAKRGCTSGPALEGPSSLARAMGGEADFDLTKNLGQSYAILENRLKPFPCGRLGHAAIEAALKARSSHDLNPAAIHSVRVHVNPRAQYLMGGGEPQNGTQAMFSIAHGVAAALLVGQAGPAQFTDEAAQDPLLADLRRRVEVVADPGQKPGQATIEVKRKDSGALTAEVQIQKGYAANPMNDGDVREKFLSLAEPVLGSLRANKVAELVYGVETLADAGELARLCS